MSDSFYRAFEERYRGSREMIKARQQAYLPFLKPLADTTQPPLALDLGCGRGEWLEVLLENGFAARGVDLDAGMLEACEALGLPAEKGEAIAALQALDDDSQALVSGFHIVEHIPFESAQVLISEALRALRPGGILILETPNPENIVVAGSSFYLDPTHERPLPHQLLSFMAEFSGFARTRVIRLQEDPQLLAREEIGVLDVLTGASPDYAIVAQKQAPEEQMAALDEAFSRHYGVALDTLARKYDASVDHRINQMLVMQLEQVVAAPLAQAQERIARLERERDQALEQRQAMLQSMSWRITGPLRRAVLLARKVRQVRISIPRPRPRPRPRLGAAGRVRPVMARALLGMRSRLLPIVRKYPWLKARLRRFRYLDHRLQGLFARSKADASELFGMPCDDDGLAPLALGQRIGHQAERKSPLESWFSQQ
ncbi:class I SAM-dependent methyltransferase [Stutzerimonas sp. FeSN7]|uniref:class I SAM-dependent methyltransferase n=1 Tax=Stutzerimonas sp. FeSN7 TaxID=3035479 RepID=UPI002556CD73|nr:class I SAM-dependent methyltransferase [Stutzerimonas sp. FeSN7]MDL2172701.1 class I SAM-dependent methyltransferase [Stutzerimonas sp. FeSN7]